MSLLLENNREEFSRIVPTDGREIPACINRGQAVAQAGFHALGGGSENRSNGVVKIRWNDQDSGRRHYLTLQKQ